jgi:predicted nucleic-acid-binding protein
MITSPVTVLEIKSVLSRSTNLREDEIEAFIDYLPEINVAVQDVNMDKIINNAIEIAVGIRMKTLDILHISASMMLEADTFVTFDSEFKAKENEIANFGLRINPG